MAYKPGQVDLRCSDAVQSAFLLHSKYGKIKEAIEVGVYAVKRGNWAFAQFLSPSDAKRALEPCIPEIARKQQRTGMWFRKNSEVLSYEILKGLARANLLPELIHKGVLRYNPFQRFSQAPDEWGFLVRSNIMKETLKTDEALKAELISSYTGTQHDDGSWGQAVSGTALFMEKLLELGMQPEDPHLTKAANWLLSQFKESVKRQRPNSSLEITVQNMFTGEDCGTEHGEAAKILNHQTLASSCFSSIPIIQTALALRVLVRLGFEDDKKVELAFQSLLDMQTKTHKHTLELPNIPLGFWCAHQCRFKLEERVRKNRRLMRTALKRFPMG